MLSSSTFRPVWGLAILLFGSLLCGSQEELVAQAEKPTPLADYFGFHPVEIFKLSDRSQNLLVGDSNQDGKLDLIVCDNSHSRIDLLQQRSDPTLDPATPAPSLNSFVSDPRFKHVKLPLDMSAASLAVGDFNRDGRLDLAYLAVPDRLVIRFQSEEGTWKRQISLRLPDLQPALWILAAGDLNHDQQDDLAILGRKETFVFLNLNEREFPQPVKLMNTNERPGLLQIQDLNGDERKDLSYLTHSDGISSFSVRLQNPQGELGPELQFDLSGPRALQLSDVDGKPGVEVVSIHGQTGRIQVHQISKEPAEAGTKTSQLVQYGLPGAGTRDQEIGVGDVTGDGRNDVVGIDADSAELILYSQDESGSLTHAQKFPTLMGGTQIRLANLDQQPGDEILILSPREKAIGASRFGEQRVAFPKLLPIQGEPVFMETVPLGEGKTGVFVLSKSAGSSDHVLTLLKPEAKPDGTIDWSSVPLGDKPEYKLPLSKAPERLMLYDQGETRLLAAFLGGDKPPRFFRIKPNFECVPLPESPRIGASLLIGKSVQQAFLDQPVLMVSQGNVVRSLSFREMEGEDIGGWEILDQYHADETGSNILSATALDFDDQPGPEIALIDQGTKKIRLLRREEGTYRPWQEVDLGGFACIGSQVADLNGDRRPDLILTGRGRFGVLFAGASEYHLKELAVYESQLEEAYFQDVTCGDLNHDGHVDLALIDTKSHRIEIVSYFAGVGLQSALSFKIFDSKHLTQEEADDQEPRESLIADVTGDGLPDLLLLTHDRLLLYPQDGGEPVSSERKTAADP